MADFELLAPGGHQKLVDEVVDRLDLKADIDGYYAQLTAGAALGITGEATDSAAWLQRVSTSDGPTTIRSIHGRTLRWNQLANCTFSTTRSTDGVTLTNNGDGSLTIDGTSTLESGYSTIEMCDIDYVANHKVLIKTGLASSASSFVNASGLGRDYGSGDIFTYATSVTMHMRITFGVGSTFSNVTFYPQLFDLTAMFGAGNEPSTVAEFEALFPEPYYEYDAGSLLSVSMTGIETNGFNQWDEKVAKGYFDGSGGWHAATSNLSSENPIPVLPGATYYISAPTGSVVHVTFWKSAVPSGASAADEFVPYRDWSSNYANTTVMVPEDARYMHFNLGSAYGVTYNHDICVNISDPTRNGEYEPYWQQTRTIPAGTLRGAGSVFDELTETERITRIGERAYQSGDESDATVVTDGTITHYALATPTTVEIDPPLNMTYRTAQGGTERVMVPTGENSAPPTIVAAQGYTAESLRDAALATIAPVENGIASTNYAVGGYLIHAGQLCKVTTAIATGEAITIGTNVTATTVMAEVIALIAQ